MGAPKQLHHPLSSNMFVTNVLETTSAAASSGTSDSRRVTRDSRRVQKLAPYPKVASKPRDLEPGHVDQRSIGQVHPVPIDREPSNAKLHQAPKKRGSSEGDRRTRDVATDDSRPPILHRKAELQVEDA